MAKSQAKYIVFILQKLQLQTRWTPNQDVLRGPDNEETGNKSTGSNIWIER